MSMLQHPVKLAKNKNVSGLFQCHNNNNNTFIPKRILINFVPYF